jgi:hypothetical protein
VLGKILQEPAYPFTRQQSVATVQNVKNIFPMLITKKILNAGDAKMAFKIILTIN